jgi:iron complex transport system ATP-binding protein
MIATDLIRARNLEFRTSGGEYLVRDLHLAVADGERLGIIVPNGAGKSTLLRMLSGTLSPTSGDIYQEATRLDAYKAVERARRLAVVGQSDQPDPRIALNDYVALGRVPHVGLRTENEPAGRVGRAR